MWTYVLVIGTGLLFVGVVLSLFLTLEGLAEMEAKVRGRIESIEQDNQGRHVMTVLDDTGTIERVIINPADLWKPDFHKLIGQHIEYESVGQLAQSIKVI